MVFKSEKDDKFSFRTNSTNFKNQNVQVYLVYPIVFLGETCCNPIYCHKMGLLLLVTSQPSEPLTWRLVSSSAVFSVGLLNAFRIPAFTL